MNKVFKVTMLGEFSIEYMNKTITDHSNRSKKVWCILEYLVKNSTKAVSQEELIDLIWDNSTSKNPNNTLKVLIHRARTALEELDFPESRDLILFKNGAYMWNPNYVCELDIDEFNRLIHLADEEENNLQRKIELLLKAETLYKGEFLERNASEPWIIPFAQQYRTLYEKLVSETSALLLSCKHYEELLKLCQKAVQFRPFDEKLHEYIIKALIATGRADKALEVFHQFCVKFTQEFNTQPSETLTCLYHDIMNTIHSPEMDLGAIREKLDDDDLNGCFYCEYEIFKSVYQLEIRNTARNEQALSICLLSIIDDDTNNVPNTKTLNRSMDSLKQTIMYSLRSGDIFTRYSVNQFLVLLPSATLEMATKVMKRLISSYEKDYPNSFITLEYSTQQLVHKSNANPHV